VILREVNYSIFILCAVLALVGTISLFPRVGG